MDLVALFVLIALAISGIVSPDEALSGFSNPAVITVWAVFILSGGLARTGVANRLGRKILKMGGNSHWKTIAVIMLIGGTLSAFMNNVGVAAMMLPVVTHISRKTDIPLSKLLIPLAFGTLLGGLTTMIGTPANILVSDALQDFGIPTFNFFDFAIVGLPMMLVGVAYMVLIGHRLLPDKDKTTEFGSSNTEEHFGLAEMYFAFHVTEDSAFAGKTLAESRIGSALKLNVIGIRRNGTFDLAPEPNKILNSGDELIVLGRSDWLDELSKGQQITLEPDLSNGNQLAHADIEELITRNVTVIEANIPASSSLIGKTISQLDFRNQYHANVLAIWRDEQAIRTELQKISLRTNDRLLLQISRKEIGKLEKEGIVEFEDIDAVQVYKLEERLLRIGIPSESSLIGKSLAESKLADAFGLSVLAILRKGESSIMPPPGMELKAGDQLIVEGKIQDVQLLRALQNLKVEPTNAPAISELESDEVGLVEVVLSPHSGLDGKTLSEINFREKFGLSVLAIWRGGESYRSNLRETPLRFGDSLLIFGHRNRIQLLSKEADFLVLNEELQEAPRSEKSSLAIFIMAAVVVSAGIGLLPIALAAIFGAALMILTKCIDMDEAYASIQWQAIFLIAGMLPMGIAMQNSGAARYLANLVIELSQPYGQTALIAGFFLLTTLASQIMPSAVVAVLMAPIALTSAGDLGYSSQSLAMIVALGASTTFLSPVGHPANVLVMGPGGYKFADFIKVGLPLTILMLIVVLLMVPIAWPLIP